MFDIGFWELATIAIIGIVVVGPDRLPEVVRTIAVYVRKARRAFHNVKSDIERELDLDELRRQMDEVDMEDHIKKLNQSIMDIDRDVRGATSRFDDELNRSLDINDPEVLASQEENYQRYDDPDRYEDTGVEAPDDKALPSESGQKTEPPETGKHD